MLLQVGEEEAEAEEEGSDIMHELTFLLLEATRINWMIFMRIIKIRIYLRPQENHFLMLMTRPVVEINEKQPRLFIMEGTPLK